MRPQRFEAFAVELASEDPAAGNATTLKEAGDSQHPFGLAAMLNGSQARIQFIAQSAPGDKYGESETPVEGDPVELAGPRADGPEGWLASLLANSGSREIAGIEQWSLRENEADRRDGLTVEFHSGAKIYSRIL